MRERRLSMGAPSFIIPATVAENALFLLGKTREISLCLFEWEACLAYGVADLPAWLASLPFEWHCHLPLNLPWEETPEKCASLCDQLLDKIAFLSLRSAVLHPPINCPNSLKRQMLLEFLQARRSSVPLLLENIQGCDVLELGGSFLQDNDLGFCLDVGHAIGFRQSALLESDLPEKAKAIHWHAPTFKIGHVIDAHRSLSRLEDNFLPVAYELLARADNDSHHVLEVFNWPDFADSLDFLGIPHQNDASGENKLKNSGMDLNSDFLD